VLFVFPGRVFSESRSLHVAALASIAIAQPLFDLLGKSPEFLLAHDLGPSEILALAAILGAGVPLVCALLVKLAGGIHETASRVTASVLVAFLVTLVALQILRSVPAAGWIVAIGAAGAGAAAGTLYHWSAPSRTFAACLAPGILIIPMLFLLRPGVRSLLMPQEHEILQSSKSATPVVLVVFDGLPLTALLDTAQTIDRHRYPSFAALADDATWYRNATTVSDYTQWAVPAILTGRYPSPKSLPIASDHPHSLYTLLGSSHSLNVQEPITRLCPQSLCDHGGEGVAHELTAFAPTLSVAYLHAIAPEEFRQRLPEVDQGWAEGLPPSDNPGEMWLRVGDHSRRGEAIAFINAIEPDGSQPSLHFLHVLLPHLPLVYLPDGHRYGTERTLPGLLDTRDRWVEDTLTVAEGYRRFLLQVGYVDALLGRLITRLKEVGLYDRALIVVASDHGGSFRPGLAHRRITDDTIRDIVPVPLIVKAPQQREGVTSDRNVETVDILPTIADMLDIDLPWRLDGISAIGAGAPKAEKTVYHDNARQMTKLPGSLREGVQASIDHKVELFGADGNPDLIPRNSPYTELLGRSVDDLQISNAVNTVEFALDVHGDFSNVEPDGIFLPAQLAGRARWLDRNDPAVIAVAVNKIVRATTRTYRFPERGVSNAWSLVLPGDSFQAGENEIEIFVVRPSGTPVLHRAHFSHARPVDLLSNAAAYGMGVTYEGLYDRQGTGERSLRWTNGAARVIVPGKGSARPQALRVNLATAGSEEKGLVIRVNDCEVFEGRVPPGPWSKVLAIPQCDDADQLTVIELTSRTHRDERTDRDLGVAIQRIDLLREPWPPPASLPDQGRRSQIRLGNVKDGDQVDSTGRLTANVVNRGTSIWPAIGDLGHENGAVRLGVLWFPKGQLTEPAAIQRIELPRTLVPGDGVEIAFDLVPNSATGRLPAGEYEAWIGLMQEGANWFYTSGDSVRKLRVIHDAGP